MHEYSRPLGDAVKQARSKLGYTQKQVADLIDVDERTIMSIEKYKSNTTMEVLYPLIRALHIDPRAIFNHEMEIETSVHHELRVLIDGCSEEEAATLISVCQSVISALRSKEGIMIGDKK